MSNATTRKRKPVEQALAPVRAERQPPPAPGHMTAEQLDLIKSVICVGANDDELKLFVQVCQRTGLDPFARQIYAIKRKGKMTIQVGIDGYRLIADRTGRYVGNDDPVFEYDEAGAPARATATVWKLAGGVRCPFSASARWLEYYPGEGDQGFMWRTKPHVLLGKVAEALALRKAFPAELSGTYTAEEMEHAEEPLRRAAASPASLPASLPAEPDPAQELKAKDAALVREGLCEAGELLAAVKAALAAKGLKWGPRSYGVAREAAAATEREWLLEAASGLLDDKGQRAEDAVAKLGLPRTTAATQLTAEQLRKVIAWLEPLPDAPGADGEGGAADDAA